MNDSGIEQTSQTVSPRIPVALEPAAQQNSRVKEIFIGLDGLRAGWRALIFLAIVVVLSFAFNAATRSFLATLAPVGTITPVLVYFSHGSLFLFTSIAALIMARIEHRRYVQYGLPARFAFGKNFRIGVVVGFLAICGCLLGIFALHGFQIDGLNIHGTTILTAFVAWSIAFVLVGLAEEFFFRGYLQFTLTTGIGFWPSALLLSGLFALAHAGNPGETKLGLAAVVLFGLLLSLFLRRTGNLWWAVGFHVGWDWGETFFYGVSDSGQSTYHNLLHSNFHGPVWLTGGSVGPEASIFTPIVLLVVAILFSLCYRENKYQIIQIKD